MAENYTLTFDTTSQGWTSFWSFFPEKIVGMNNYLYTFKNGNLYQHNVNETRNNFYGQQYNSKVTSVVNAKPLVNKVFKTLYLESDDSWSALLNTDKISGNIDYSWFEKKESDWFAFIRLDEMPASGSGSTYEVDPALQLRSVNGIGEIAGTTVISPTQWRLEFGPEVVIDPVLIQPRDEDPASPSFGQGGDIIYDLAGIPNPRPIGRVYDLDLVNNYIYVDPTGLALLVPFVGDVLICVKSSAAESNGLLGHYLEFTLENDNTEAVEMFAVASDVMDSYPIS